MIKFKTDKITIAHFSSDQAKLFIDSLTDEGNMLLIECPDEQSKKKLFIFLKYIKCWTRRDEVQKITLVRDISNSSWEMCITFGMHLPIVFNTVNNDQTILFYKTITTWIDDCQGSHEGTIRKSEIGSFIFQINDYFWFPFPTGTTISVVEDSRRKILF